jgi:hypothetical protein
MAEESIIPGLATMSIHENSDNLGEIALTLIRV